MIISILDYGVGNVGSVQNALRYLGFNAAITSDASTIDRSDILVVPGQGAAGDAMAALQSKDLIQPIRHYIRSNRPYIGICLGFQLLFDHTDEDGGVDGLGIFSGQVKKFDPSIVKIPQMGWNELHITHDPHQLTRGLATPITAYFANSYYVIPDNPDIVFTTTHHGIQFTSAIQTPTVLGCQFHPEKSGDVGLHILKGFITHHAQ